MKTENTAGKRFRLSNISLVCLVRMVMRHLWMVVFAALIMAMGTSVYLSVLRAPVYRANMTYAVTSRKTSYTSSSNMTAAREVAAVLTELLKTDVLITQLQDASEELADFSGTIQATQVPESNFITVSVLAETPEKAFSALSTLVEIVPDLSQYISTSSVVQIIRNPAVSAVPANQLDENKLCLQFGIVGGLLMVALLCYLSIRREAIQTRSGARHLLDAPVLVSVCHERKNRTLKTALRHSNKGLQIFSPTTSFAYAEQIHALSTQLEHEIAVHDRKVFLVAGVGENEGKSTIAANLAVDLASRGKKVALVDADLRKPSMHLFFEGKYRAPLPLNKLLAEPFNTENLSRCMLLHNQLGIYMLFSTTSDRRSTELITGGCMQELLNALRALDCVIVDTPPMGFFPDAEAIADMADASLLVVRQDYTAAADINDAVDSLRQTKAAFLGCVLNDMMSSAPSHYGYGRYGYGRYGYGYGYGYGHGKSESSAKTKSSSRKNG